jgi:DNA-binding transcriptional LysR family regulator
MVVAEELHFGRAAQRLGMTQPPLSRAIRRLERRLGVTLLLRTGRQVALTAAGEVLLRDGRKALQAVDAAVRWAQRTGRDDPRLLLARKSGSDAGLLARILRAYADEPDSLPVQVVHTATERIAMLRDGRADVALLHRPSNDPRRAGHQGPADGAADRRAAAGPPAGRSGVGRAGGAARRAVAPVAGVRARPCGGRAPRSSAATARCSSW